VLDRKPLFASKYYMAHGHWQICNWGSTVRASRRFGRAETVRVEDAPPVVVQTALKAANLMGDGFYGVDMKDVGGVPVVIEVNDNPSIDSGVEDVVLKDGLYQAVIRSIIARVEDPHKQNDANNRHGA
jgi:glutathione synthase/RimK-type ligase-like ATP-grasp enzyme